MKKNKEYQVLTFMSWEENFCHTGGRTETTRAIALCDMTGYFNCAINTLREDMGKKDENGVYERKWWSDYAYEDEDYRPATSEEVALYLRYVTWQEAVGDDLEVKCIVTDGNTKVICERKKDPLWYRIKCLWWRLRNRLQGKEENDDLPF